MKPDPAFLCGALSAKLRQGGENDTKANPTVPVRDSSALLEGTGFSFRILAGGESRPEAADVELLCGASHPGMVGLEVPCMTGAILSELLLFLFLPILHVLSPSVTGVTI